MVPNWVPLAPELAKYTDDILKYWEWRSNKVQRYRCRFKRFEYDPVHVPDPRVFFSYAEGAIKYAAPDKGLFKVDNSSQVVLPLVQGEKPKYERRDPELNEHWVCDGKAIFEFNGRAKQLIKRDLPPEMQGKEIAQGPLPFLFNAKAADIKQRYWVRALDRPPKQKTWHLEAFPKTQQDAADFLKIHIIIAADEDELPEAIILFHRNKARTTYAFEQREENWSVVIEKLNLFHREFFEPKAPSGWTKVMQDFQRPNPLLTPSPVLQTQRPHNAVAR